MIPSDHIHHFLQKAIQLATEGMQSGRGGPFGCVVVRNGEVIAEGSNEVTGTNDPTAHAEVVAIRRACTALGSFQLTGCEVYCSCEPCPMCLGALYWARPARVYYAATRGDAAAAGFDDDLIYREIAMDGPERSLPFTHVPHRESLHPFEAWLEKGDKEAY